MASVVRIRGVYFSQMHQTTKNYYYKSCLWFRKIFTEYEKLSRSCFLNLKNNKALGLDIAHSGTQR
jgi:hypothetical protein